MNVEEFKETFLQHMNEDEQKVCAALTLVVTEDCTLNMQVEGNGFKLIAALRGIMTTNENVAKLIMASVIEAMTENVDIRDKFIALLETV